MAKGIRKQGAASIMASGFFRLAVYACIIFAVIFVGKSAYDFGYAIFNEVPMADGEGTDITVVIKDGSSVYQIGKILKKKGLIEDAKVFVVQEKLSNYKDKLQAGTYILNTNMTAEEMMAILARENVDGQPTQGDGTDGNSAVQDTSETDGGDTDTGSEDAGEGGESDESGESDTGEQE
ncbi:endolytic transglycosylase MltG [Blautia producta]|uniref:Endolytic transglycosylase MltG n=1 Tax=Blautia producta TaxID=33035 RepID=A0A4V0Z7E7_9FIRM|nr:endolytic transglycosylase MltG [Blautia producta]QBE96538.1 hypothetical protein PMF13cell1_02084 [Blautia producta]